MKRLLILIVCFYFVQIASAMDDNTRRINAIKVDTTFLYADVTMRTQKEAISHANELLRQEIQAWAGYLPSNWGDEKGTPIITRRLDKYRAFVYISKDSLRQLSQGNKEGVIDQVKKAKTFFELKNIMEPLKQSGEIVDYGKYATMKDPEKCHLIIYDVAGNVLALLGKGNEERWNLTTDKNDNMSNYRGCGAIWFILKEQP